MTDSNMPLGVFTLGLRELAFVPRWTVARTTRKPSVAEHSYYVAQYADGIADLIEWGGDKGKLIRYALWHDVEEMITGDIPGPVKRGMEWNKRFDYTDNLMVKHYDADTFVRLEKARSHREIVPIVKVADILEDLMFAAEQRRFGNGWMHKVWINDRLRLEPAIARLPGMDDDLKLRTTRSVLFNFVDVVAFQDPILPE